MINLQTIYYTIIYTQEDNLTRFNARFLMPPFHTDLLGNIKPPRLNYLRNQKLMNYLTYLYLLIYLTIQTIMIYLKNYQQ